MKNILCCDCQYCGDKYSFPLPNDLIEVDSENPFIKHYYCCCGDSEFYGKDITNLDLTKLLKGVGFDTKPPMFEVNRDVLENMVWQDDGEIKMVIEVDV